MHRSCLEIEAGERIKLYMTLSKEEIKKRFNQLSSIKSEEEHYLNEAMMLHYRIIQLVETVMDKNNWNKKQLANKLGMSQSYITQLFTGSKMVNMQTLARLQDALEFSFKFETEEKKIEGEME